jgi:hypothetical protein
MYSGFYKNTGRDLRHFTSGTHRPPFGFALGVGVSSFARPARKNTGWIVDLPFISLYYTFVEFVSRKSPVNSPMLTPNPQNGAIQLDGSEPPSAPRPKRPRDAEGPCTGAKRPMVADRHEKTSSMNNCGMAADADAAAQFSAVAWSGAPLTNLGPTGLPPSSPEGMLVCGVDPIIEPLLSPSRALLAPAPGQDSFAPVQKAGKPGGHETLLNLQEKDDDADDGAAILERRVESMDDSDEGHGQSRATDVSSFLAQQTWEDDAHNGSFQEITMCNDRRIEYKCAEGTCCPVEQVPHTEAGNVNYGWLKMEGSQAVCSIRCLDQTCYIHEMPQMWDVPMQQLPTSL